MERDAAREALVRSAVTELVSLAAFAIVFTIMTNGDALRLAAARLWGRRPGSDRQPAGWEMAEHRRDVYDIARGGAGAGD